MFESKAFIHAEQHKLKKDGIVLPAVQNVNLQTLGFLEEKIQRETELLDNIHKPKETEHQKKVRMQVERRRKEKGNLSSGAVIDEATTRFQAPKIYQYTAVEKQKHSIEEPEFNKYLNRKYRSLKGNEKKIAEHYEELYGDYKQR